MVARLRYGVEEVLCPWCRADERRLQRAQSRKVKRRPTLKQEQRAKRNRELLDLVETSPLEQAEAALDAVCETIVEAAATPDPDSPTCRPDQDAGETKEVVELEVAQ